YGPPPIVGTPVRQREAVEAQKRTADDLEAKTKELEAQKNRVEELQAKLGEFETQKAGAAETAIKVQALEEKLSQYERQQGEILENLSAKDRALEERDKEVLSLRQEIEEARAAVEKAKVEAQAKVSLPPTVPEKADPSESPPIPTFE